MEICHGWARHPIRLSATRKYLDVEIRELCRKHAGPYWLRVEGTAIHVRSECCLQLACKASAVYHNELAHAALADDGFAADMAAREHRLLDDSKTLETDGSPP